MRDQDPTLDRLFDAYRSIARAPSAERDRLRGKVATQLAAAGVLATSTAVTAKAVAGGLALTSTPTLLGLTKGKLALVLLALAFIGAAGTLLLVSVPPDQTESIKGALALPTMAPTQPIVVAASSEPAAETPAPAAALDGTSAQSAPNRNASARTEHNGLAEELAAIRGAQSALAAGEAPRALRLLETYLRRFPGGVLLPEARATQIRALCRAGHTERANRQAERFETLHPDSPLAAGHKLRCGSNSP